MYFIVCYTCNCISGVMVNILAPGVIDRGFEPLSEIDICCFSAEHAVLRSKSEDWLARNLDNVSEWGDM